MISREIIEKLPKTDLHVHLDGSVRLGTLIELAREYRVNLPSYTEEGLKDTVFKAKYRNLEEYLAGFSYVIQVMQSEVALERVSYEFAQDNQAEGVCYVEVRFAPQFHVHSHLAIENVLRSVDRGLRRAKDEYNRRPEVASGDEPRFEYSIVVCAMRAFGPGLSEYLDKMLHVHRFSPPIKVYGMTSLELARSAVRVRDEYRVPIMGFDLAGPEAGFPAEDHVEAYDYAHRNFMMKTVHAGEAYGPESIFQAITALHADRIGHGTYLLDASMIKDPAIQDPQRYVKKLAQYIADRRITLEICLTSNMQTNPNLKRLEDHALVRMQEMRLSTTICTDNRTVSNTTVSNELELAVKHLGFTAADIKRCLVYGFKRSFFPGTYLEKRRYVRGIIDYYEKLERENPELAPHESQS